MEFVTQHTNKEFHINTTEQYSRKIYYTKQTLKILAPKDSSGSHTITIIIVVFLLLLSLIGVVFVILAAPSIVKKPCGIRFVKTTTDSVDYQTRPTSIAVGDFNNDGINDIAIAYSHLHSIQVLFGYGDGSFGNASVYGFGPNTLPTSIVVGDINGDNYLDMVVAKSGANTIDIMQGSSSGLFTLTRSISTGNGRPRWIILNDFDGNKRLDIGVINNGINSFTIYYTQADGNFSQPRHFFTGHDSLSVALCGADVNNDGRMDALVVNAGSNSIGIWLQRNDSEFDHHMLYLNDIHSEPSAIVVGDFDNDGQKDIALTTVARRQLIIMSGHGNGTFKKATSYLLSTNVPRAIQIHDFNKDGHQDLVIVGEGRHNILIFIGQGNGFFHEPQLYMLRSELSLSVAVTKLNDDDVSDITVANFDTNNFDVLLGSIRIFSRQVKYPAGISPFAIISAKMNDDPYLDVVILNRDANSIAIVFGDGDGTFRRVQSYQTDEKPNMIDVVDLNNDQYLDVIVTSSVKNLVNIFYGSRNGSLAERVVKVVSYPQSFLATGDLNNDKITDFIVSYTNFESIGIFLSKNNTSFSSETLISTGRTPYGLSIADFNDDGNMDIVVVNHDSNNMGLYLGYGNGTFQQPIIYVTGPSPFLITKADLNNDGRLDIVVTNLVSNFLNIFLGISNGSLFESKVQSVKFPARYTVTAQVDDDEINDMIMTIRDENKFLVYLGNGDGTFKYHSNYSTGSIPFSLTVGDFNMDNHSDIIVGNFGDNSFGVFLHNYTYELTISSSFSSSTGLALKHFIGVDLDHDRQSDLILSTHGAQDIIILFSNGRGEFLQRKSYTIHDRLNILGIGDFDGDSVLDIVATSYDTQATVLFIGSSNNTFNPQNTIGPRFKSDPSALTVSDLDRDNKTEVIVTVTNDEAIYILSTYQIPHFSRSSSFIISRPTFVSLNDFNEDGIIDVLTISYYDASVMIYTGFGNGSFELHSTIPTVKYPYDASVADINKDSHLDIIVIDYTENILQILFGYGNGTFYIHLSLKTGNDPTSVAVQDVNNDFLLDILVTNYLEDTIDIYFGTVNNQFSIQTKIYTERQTFKIKIEDINKDNQWDLLLINHLNRNIGVMFGYGNGSFSNQTIYSTKVLSFVFDVNDINSDGNLDIVVGNADGTLLIFMGRPDGIFNEPNILKSVSPTTYIVLQDINYDSKIDMVVVFQVKNKIGLFLGHGNGSFDSDIGFETAQRPIMFALGHVNNDTYFDIVLAEYFGDSIGLYIGSPSYTLRINTTLSTNVVSSSHSLLVADVNDDNLMDIIVAYESFGFISIFLNKNNLCFTEERLYSTQNGSSFSSIVVGDYNGDHQVDIIVIDTTRNDLGIFFGMGNSSFGKHHLILTGFNSQPVTAVGYDFNGDKLSDIAYIDKLSNKVEVLLGRGDGTFYSKIVITTPYGSVPTSFVVGYFNNDTKPDIAILNGITNSINIFLQSC